LYGLPGGIPAGYVHLFTLRPVLGRSLAMKEDWPTTRRFPRTQEEAFRDADYASPLHHPPKRVDEGWVWVAIAFVLAFLFALL
jgi:hypothetical protein